jgi:hypothetical protein
MPAGPLRTTYARILLRNGQCSILCHPFLFFPLSFHLSFSRRAFSHGASLRLASTPRRSAMSECSGCVWLVSLAFLFPQPPSNRAERISCESSARVSENGETWYARAVSRIGKCLCRRSTRCLSFVTDDALMLILRSFCKPFLRITFQTCFHKSSKLIFSQFDLFNYYISDFIGADAKFRTF